VIPFAALSGPLPKLGVIAVAALAAVALVAREERPRAVAIVGALVLSPVLLLADIWHSAQLGVVHRHPLAAAAAGLVALGVVAAVAVLIARRPALFAWLAVLAVPFRVPIMAAGITSNLLVPLYLVVAAGSLAFAVPALRREPAARPPREPRRRRPDPRWIERLLALVVVAYAVQSVYSPDFEKALQQMVFFYVPFTLLFCLLRRLEWTPALIRTCLLLVCGLAVLFALVGFVEYATKTLFLNPKLIAADSVHTYFTVNSVFFDPDIFGRFLALVMILLAAVLLYSRRGREQVAATAVLAILWAALVLTLSRSSLAALLVGLAILGALHWNVSRTVLIAIAVVALGAAAVAVSPKTFGLNQGLNGASSGRAGLISGGVTMFEQRPVWGYGSGSFVYEYRKQHPATSQNLAASHTIAVTIAAEQGLIGEVLYVALLFACALVLVRGARTDPPRAAIAAAFLALAFHTLLYADFLEDPVTWTLLGIGTALALGRRGRGLEAPAPPEKVPVPA
jgi:O-antigen ligase